MITPITYLEAERMLGVASGTVRIAVSRGVLTLLPRQGVKQKLSREQVLLFKGKRLSLSSLDDNERKLWEECKNAIHPQEREVPQVSPFHLTQYLSMKMKRLLEITRVPMASS